MTDQNNDPNQVQYVAWAYMVELDDGLTKDQILNLLSLATNEEELVPFSNEAYLESNSIAYGFVLNSHYDHIEEIQQTLADVCDDWDNERSDFTYTTPGGLKVLMLCDVPTVK